jgi:hypothetical protein
MRYARCACCREFYLENRLAKLQCPSCTYTTYRCKGCDGKEGAYRSIRAHFNWYRSRADGVGGHRGALEAKRKRRWLKAA